MHIASIEFIVMGLVIILLTVNCANLVKLVIVYKLVSHCGWCKPCLKLMLCRNCSLRTFPLYNIIRRYHYNSSRIIYTDTDI